MTVVFLIDMSASLSFGSLDQTKVSLSAEVVSVLAFAAIKNNDRVGMLSFTDTIEHVIRPKKGKNNILRMVSELLSFKPHGIRTSISTGLKAINEIWRKKALVFLVSDFKDTEYEKALKLTAKRHDLICINIADPREKNIPPVGMIDFYDPEQNKFFTIDSSSKTMMKNYYNIFTRLDDERKNICKRSAIDSIELVVGRPYIAELAKFFNSRQKRRFLK